MKYDLKPLFDTYGAIICAVAAHVHHELREGRRVTISSTAEYFLSHKRHHAIDQASAHRLRGIISDAAFLGGFALCDLEVRRGVGFCRVQRTGGRRSERHDTVTVVIPRPARLRLVG